MNNMYFLAKENNLSLPESVQQLGELYATYERRGYWGESGPSFKEIRKSLTDEIVKAGERSKANALCISFIEGSTGNVGDTMSASAIAYLLDEENLGLLLRKPGILLKNVPD